MRHHEGKEGWEWEIKHCQEAEHIGLSVARPCSQYWAGKQLAGKEAVRVVIDPCRRERRESCKEWSTRRLDELLRP